MTWYPVIDYQLCQECGACVAKCTHGVYDEAKAPVPVVVSPAGCVDHCHGCGDLCPAGAITYVGDDTGWSPPNGVQELEKGGCSCGCEMSDVKSAVVEYLYLDLKTCDRCLETEEVLDRVMERLVPVLELAGYTVDYRKEEMATAEIAEEHGFLSSPTIRVNGRDICRTVEETGCDCCSDISGAAVDCRVFEHEGEAWEVPPETMLAEAILRSVFGPADGLSCCGGYELPDNLRTFYDGKRAGQGCLCGGDCG